MKNVIIMGRPRTGKSTLATMVSNKFNYQIIRTDAIRNAFKIVFPELNIKPNTAINNEKFQIFCLEFLKRNLREARNDYAYVVEGCETSIKDCKKLYGNDENNLIYVLGQVNITPEKMAENIRMYDTDLDWTRKLNDEELLEECKDTIQRSKIIQKECEENGLNFFDTSIDRKNVLENIIKDIEEKYR